MSNIVVFRYQNVKKEQDIKSLHHEDSYKDWTKSDKENVNTVVRTDEGV